MKIYTYGCSFTSYHLPTYADILGINYDVINRGWSGSGNEKIFYFFMQDIKNNKITDKDIVILQWSGITRWNYLNKENEWLGDGNIFLPHNKQIYQTIQKWYNPDYELEKTHNYCVSAESLLKNIGCQYVFLSLNQIPKSPIKFLMSDLETTYKGNYEFRRNEIGKRIKKIVDEHPTVLQHYDIASKIASHFDLDISNTKRKVNDMHLQIIKELRFRIKFKF